MSPEAQRDGVAVGQTQAPGAAYARVNAVFELRGESRDRLAESAAELLHALQQIASTPDCECDLDVSLDVKAAGER